MRENKFTPVFVQILPEILLLHIAKVHVAYSTHCWVIITNLKKTNSATYSYVTWKSKRKVAAWMCSRQLDRSWTSAYHMHVWRMGTV